MTWKTFIAAWGICWMFLPIRTVAQESGPSNTVGFWKLDVHPGFTQVSFPLLPADKTVNNVLGNQLTGGTSASNADQIQKWDAATGQFLICWLNSGTGQWEGAFSQLSEALSYWIYVQPDHPATQTIVICGNVVEDPVYNMGQMQPGYNAVGSVWAIPAAVSLAGLNGFHGGTYMFLSDLILSYDALSGQYTYAWKDANGYWQGNLTQFEPMKGYWIYLPPGHSAFNWNNYPQPNSILQNAFEIPRMLPEKNRSVSAPAAVMPIPSPPHPVVQPQNSRISPPVEGGTE
jgi:hypothetical protein